MDKGQVRFHLRTSPKKGERLTTEYNPFSAPVIPLTATAVPPVNDSETLAPPSVVSRNGAEIVELGTSLT